MATGAFSAEGGTTYGRVREMHIEEERDITRPHLDTIIRCADVAI